MWKLYALLCCVLFSGCCSSQAATKMETSSKPWEVLVNGCQKSDGENYACKKDALEKTYDNLVNLQTDLDECNVWRDGERKLCDVELGERDGKIYELNVKLGAWYRKWYITIPLGLAVGVGAGMLASELAR